MDSFKDMPQTISEIRSDKSLLGKDWTPRDLLVSLLRGIDSGELNMKSCVVFFRYESDDESTFIGFRQACPSALDAMGLAYVGAMDMHAAQRS